LDLRAALGSLRPAEIRAGLPFEVLAIELLEPLRYHPCGLAARRGAGEEVSLVVGEALGGGGDAIRRGVGREVVAVSGGGRHETRGRIGNAGGSRGRVLPRGFRLPLRHLEIEFGGELLELPGWDRRGRERVGVYGRGRAAATGRGGAGKGEHAKGRGNNGGERCSFLVRHDVSLSDECREPDRSESRGRSQDVRINLAAVGV